MTTHIHRPVAALAATVALLAAASPAQAIYRSYEGPGTEEPTYERTAESDNTSGGAGCSVTLSTGQTIVYADGYSFSIINKSTGKKHTFTCKNGKWEETVEAPRASDQYAYEADHAYVEDASTNVVVVNPREHETYETSGWSYSQG